MTNQAILNQLNEIIAYGNENNLYEYIQKIIELRTKLIEDMENSDAKKNGKSDILKGFKYVLKNAKENCMSKLHSVFKYENQYVVTDTHNLLMYGGKLNFTEANNVEDCPEFIEKALKTIPDGEFQTDDELVKIEIPSKTVVKNIISEQKAYNKVHHLTKKTEKPAPIYHVENDGVSVNINAEYLLNLIDMGITELYCKGYAFYGFNEDRSLKGIVFGCRKR